MRGDRRSSAFWAVAFRRLQLAWRLLRDRRVPALYKLLPVATLIYIFSPLDFLPDWLLGLGQVDDLALFLLSVQVFTSIVPRQIVEAILDEMSGRVVDGEWRRADTDRPPTQLPRPDW